MTVARDPCVPANALASLESLRPDVTACRCFSLFPFFFAPFIGSLVHPGRLPAGGHPSPARNLLKGSDQDELKDFAAPARSKC